MILVILNFNSFHKGSCTPVENKWMKKVLSSIVPCSKNLSGFFALVEERNTLKSDGHSVEYSNCFKNNRQFPALYIRNRVTNVLHR